MTTLPEAKLYIDGKLCSASNGATYEITNPWTGGVAGKAADCAAEDVDAAIASRAPLQEAPLPLVAPWVTNPSYSAHK